MNPTIAFIGLGTMGGPMAERLVRHGYAVRGADVDADRLAAFEAVGGLACHSIAHACAGAGVVITMLPRDQHVRAVVLGDDGVIAHAAPGTLLLEMSTVSPATSLVLHTALARAGIRMLDAPVGRTPEDARAGTLLVMAGGDERDFRAAMPLFEAFADTFIHLGPAGAGIRMKVANNYMTMVSMALAAETLALAEKAGIDVLKATEVLQNTVAGRGQINVNFPRKVLAGDIQPDFPIDMGHKDLSLALQLGHELQVPLFLGASALELFGAARAQGRGAQDCTAMLLALEQMSGQPPWMNLGEGNS